MVKWMPLLVLEWPKHVRPAQSNSRSKHIFRPPRTVPLTTRNRYHPHSSFLHLHLLPSPNLPRGRMPYHLATYAFHGSIDHSPGFSTIMFTCLPWSLSARSRRLVHLPLRSTCLPQARQGFYLFNCPEAHAHAHAPWWHSGRRRTASHPPGCPTAGDPFSISTNATHLATCSLYVHQTLAEYPWQTIHVRVQRRASSTA